MFRAPRRRPLAVGDKVKFAGEKTPYKVRAVSPEGRWVVCTRPFNPQRTVQYTVIDFVGNVRGPDDRVFCEGYESDADCAARVAELASGEIAVSVRHAVVLDIESVDYASPVWPTRAPAFSD